MRSKTNWQDAQPGVLVFVPDTRVSVDQAEQSLSQLFVTDDTDSAASQVSNISDSILPSCENESNVRVKDESIDPVELRHASDDSPVTLAGDVNADFGEMLLDISPDARSTPESSASSDILFQLREAAGSSPPRYDSPCPATAAAEYSAIEATDEFLEVCYDSDRTDFQESPSPSVRKSKNVTKRTTSAVSRHFKRRARTNAAQLPVRRLNFGGLLKKQAAKKAKKTEHAQALVDLRNIENEPSHVWKDDERETLCVLNRWFCGTDRASERYVFAKLFNSIFKLDILPKRVRGQFENHLRLFGGEAFPIFGQVFSVPFHDPNNCYTQIRTLIEAEAAMLGLDLRRRQADSTKPSGMAKSANSPTTREIYRSLVQKASQEGEWLTEDATQIPPYVAATSMAVCVPPEEDWEILTDVEDWEILTHVEDSPESLIDHGLLSRHESYLTRPHLTFRVWDESKRGKFIDGRFLAEAFLPQTWKKSIPDPIPPGDPYGAFEILASLHISKQGNTPVFMSTSSSLLQVLRYATEMEHPQLALIDLDAPSLQQKHKVHNAAEVLKGLKAEGIAQWARYKAHGEFMIWAEISSDAILNILDLADLTTVLSNDADCHSLLNFDVFKPSTKTNAIAAVLRKKNLTLNTSVSRSLGKIAKIFGMGGRSVSMEHLQDFVARLIDGWTITKTDTVDIQTMSSLAVAFAIALGPHEGGHSLQEIMAAFMEGVDHGTRCVKHWSRSGRQRFRSA